MDFEKLLYKKLDKKYELTAEKEEYTIKKRRRYFREDDGQWLSKKVVCGGYATISAGHIEVRKGYRWDGPSGPTFDTEDAMRASLFHDVLYQCITGGTLSIKNRRKADLVMKRILSEEGVLQFRFLVWYAFVRLFGGYWLTDQIASTPPLPPEDINSRTISP